MDTYLDIMYSYCLSV